MRDRIDQYISTWKRRGYPSDIPDEVPKRLMQMQLAPSYQAIAIAILSNDHALESLGFVPRKSPWYMHLKRCELESRAAMPLQLDFWR